MSYRGPALQYKIRKTTVNNKTGDNYSITIPSVLAKQFQECFFRLRASGTCLIFESGCKLTITDIDSKEEGKKIILGGATLSFK